MLDLSTLPPKIEALRTPDKVARSVCPYCAVGCQLDLHVKDDQLMRVTSPWIEENTPNQGSTCVKGRFGYDFTQHRDRLTVHRLDLPDSQVAEHEDAVRQAVADLVAAHRAAQRRGTDNSGADSAAVGRVAEIARIVEPAVERAARARKALDDVRGGGQAGAGDVLLVEEGDRLVLVERVAADARAGDDHLLVIGLDGQALGVRPDRLVGLHALCGGRRGEEGGCQAERCATCA